jgi:hypothetical protein
MTHPGGLARTVLFCLAGLLALPGVLSAEGDEPSSVIEVTFTRVAPTAQAIQGEVVFKSLEEDEPARGHPISPELRPLSLVLPAGSVWEVAGEVPGFWVRRQTLAIGPAGSPTRVNLALWPLGTISGTVTLQDQKSPPPRSLRVETVAVPAFLNRPPVPPGALDCPLDEQGRWSCALPAAVFDLVLSSPGWTPAYRWAVEVKGGKSTNLGVIDLARGASVAGWVAVDGGALSEDCVVRLAPLVSQSADLRTAIDLDRTATERPVRRDGFFQVTGVSPGTYSIEMRQPGFSPAVLSPVQVDPAAETFLREPLILERPLALAFEIEPPLDWLGRPWRAQVIRDTLARLDPVVFEGPAHAEGRFEVPDQAAGRFHVTILDSLGNKVWSQRNLTVTGPPDAVQRLHLDFVDVEGTARMGQEPLTGVLWFGGKNATLSIKMETDTEGRFFGVLPRDGVWPVEIETAQPGLRRMVRVDVQASRTGKATVDLRLPNTRVFGRVLDETGKPAQRATVFAEGEGLPQMAQAGEAGTFELWGLQEGLLRLAAEAPTGVSETVFTTLAEGRDVGPVDLRLRRLERHQGSVSAAYGPVPGAEVLVSAFPVAVGGAAGTSGTDGTFSVQLAPGVEQVVAAVAAPGFPLQVFGPLAPDALRLHLGDQSGDLELVVPVQPAELIAKNLTFFVFSGAHMVPFGLVSQWAGSQGETWVEGERVSLRVPRMAPGEYRFCLVPRLAEVTFSGSLPEAGATCDTGQLAPGGQLSLAPDLSPR